MDAPGVRDFAPPASLVRAAERGFVEIHASSVDLPIQGLPGTWKSLVARYTAPSPRGRIAARRYESYREDCFDCTRSWLTGRWCGPPAHVATRTAIDVFEFAADRNPVRNTRHLQTAPQSEFAQVVRLSLLLPRLDSSPGSPRRTSPSVKTFSNSSKPSSAGPTPSSGDR